MNICVLTHTFPRFSGDPTAPFMIGVCEGLAKAGNKVFVLTPYHIDFTNTQYKLFTLKTYQYIFPDFLHTLGYSQSLKNDKTLTVQSLLLAPFMIIAGFFSLLLLVKKEKIDVVSAHWILPNGFIAVLVKFFTGVKVVSTLPGSDVYIARQHWFFRAMAYVATTYSDGITSNSPELKNDLMKLKAKIKKFVPIVYTVDTKKFYAYKTFQKKLRVQYKLSSRDVMITGVGRLVEKKGFLYLIRALRYVIKKQKNVRCMLIGDGDQKPLLETEVKKLHLEKYVIFAGKIHHTRLIAYYNLADIFILPSVRDEEGNLDDQSVSVMEAMACERAVVTSDLPGYKLVITHKKNGMLVQEKNIPKLAEALLTLVASSKMRLSMGKAARKTIREKFSWKQIGKEYTEFFKSL